MKKKLLVSVLAGMCVAGSAQAVYVNKDGTGQVLLYPYYSVQNGFDTYVHVVNTTSRAKAVKVRFLEGKNSQEVLDFNLYLSPYDEWTAVLARSANGTLLKTFDTSCTAPQIPASGVEFRSFRYTDDSVNGTDRTREGYIEMIEMGDLDNTLAMPDSTLTAEAAVTHSDGVPANCGIVRTAANATGVFNTDPAYVHAPTGGLYGFNTLINVEQGRATSLDATAIDNFFNAAEHTSPGNLRPSLEDVATGADIINGNQIVRGWLPLPGVGEPVDPVSAILARSAIMNDYNVAPGVAAMTDWIVTFPTKRFYVNPSVTTATNANYVFAERWNRTTSRSCEPFAAEYYDREEATRDVGDDDFSPAPEIPGLSLCNEVNTVSIVRNGETGTSIFGAEFTNAQIELDPDFNEGWMRMSFIGANAVAGMVGDDEAAQQWRVSGLPVIGFSATSFTNGSLSVNGVNVLSNYLGSTVHKGERRIVAE